MLKSIREHQANRLVQHVRSLMLLSRRRLPLSPQADEIQGTCHLWVEVHAMFVAKESSRASSSGMAEMVVLGKSTPAGFGERVDFGSEEGDRQSLRRASITTNNCCDSVASSARTCSWAALSRNMTFSTMLCRGLNRDTFDFGSKDWQRQDISTNCCVGSFLLGRYFGALEGNVSRPAPSLPPSTDAILLRSFFFFALGRLMLHRSFEFLHLAGMALTV